MSSFAIKQGQKMTLNISMGDGKRIGQGHDGGRSRTGGGLKALKKPLAPLAKPSGSQPSGNSMMGFGMGGGASQAQQAPAQEAEIDLLGVDNSKSESVPDGPTDLLSAFGHESSAPVVQ
jgi:hypothetical protein